MLAEFFISKFGEWPLFGKQIEFITVSLGPRTDNHSTPKLTARTIRADLQKISRSTQSRRASEF